jgi:hypothetical protein
MAVYSVQGQQNTLTTTYKTALGFTAAASGTIRRGKVFDINVSQSGAPASTDTNIQFDLSAQTAAGTSTAYTAVTNDPADAVFSGLAGVNYTIEPTVTANSSRFNIGLNQRAPYRWQTYLGSGAELVYPATASAGFVLRALSAGYTGAAGGTVYIQEQ